MYDEQNGKGAVWRELKEHFDEQKVFISIQLAGRSGKGRKDHQQAY